MASDALSPALASLLLPRKEKALPASTRKHSSS